MFNGLEGFYQIIINVCAGITILAIGFLISSFLNSKEGN